MSSASHDLLDRWPAATCKTEAVATLQPGSIPAIAGFDTGDPIKDPTVRWQDTFSEAPDGTIFLMTSHIQDLAYFKQGAPVALFTELWSFKPQ